MNYLKFGIILTIWGSLLISNGYSAPGVIESQPSNETKTEKMIEESNASSENDSNSANDKMKTAKQLKQVCESKFNQSKWMDNTCFYFHNIEVRSFDDAQKVCSDKFKKYGFDNGRIYEPRNEKTFVKIYKLAEKFANYQTLQLWLGLHDNEKEGEFRYDSDKELPTMETPWGRSQPNGGTRENCLTSFIPDLGESPEWFDRPCFEYDGIGEHGHRFMCECRIKEENITEKVSTNSSSKDELKVDETSTKLKAESKDKSDNSTKTENISKNDSVSTENPILASTSTTIQNVLDSNPDLNVDTKTTAIANNAKSTTSPTKEAAEPLVQKIDFDSNSSRGFDGWSFFGGIIITVGMAAIAFIGVKYYKTRNPRSLNYNLF